MNTGYKKLVITSLYCLIQFPVNAQFAIDDTSYVRNFKIRTVEILRPDFFPKTDEEKKKKGYETDSPAYQKLYFNKQGKIFRIEFGTYPEDDGKMVFSYSYGTNNKIAKLERSGGGKTRKTLISYDNQHRIKEEITYNHTQQVVMRESYDWQNDTLVVIKRYSFSGIGNNVSLKYSGKDSLKYNKMNKLIEGMYYSNAFQNKDELTCEVFKIYNPDGQVAKETYKYSKETIEIIYKYDSEKKLVNKQKGNEQTQFQYSPNGILIQHECSSVNGNTMVGCPNKVIYTYTFWK